MSSMNVTRKLAGVTMRRRLRLRARASGPSLEGLVPRRHLVEHGQQATAAECGADDGGGAELQPHRASAPPGKPTRLDEVVEERGVDERRLAQVDHDELVLGNDLCKQRLELLARRQVVVAAAL